ncbi:MAG: hypothetical protein R6U98_26630, partial [Pirellulaceae bacterium]
GTRAITTFRSFDLAPVTVWDLASGEALLELEGLDEHNQAWSFTLCPGPLAGGARLAAGGWRGTTLVAKSPGRRQTGYR